MKTIADRKLKRKQYINIRYLIFRISFPEVLCEGSDLVQHQHHDFSGTCCVTAAGNQGTGFLFCFRKRLGKKITGFITTTHGVRGMHGAVPVDQINLEFRQLGLHFRLSNIIKPKTRPLIEKLYDIYFARLSSNFLKEVGHNIPIYEMTNTIHESQMHVPQYPGGNWSVGCAYPIGWNDDQGINTHFVSTLGGSSGAPLLQEVNGRLFVIGMHLGAASNNSNFAISIFSVSRILQNMSRGVAGVNIPMHVPLQTAESSGIF